MDGMRAWSLCSLSPFLLFLALQVTWASVSVKVAPRVEVVKGQTAYLPCDVTGSDVLTAGWFFEVADKRTRVAFWSDKSSGVDETPMLGRVSMAANKTLIISSVQFEDEHNYTCQASAGAAGTAEGRTDLRIFYEPEEPEAVGSKNIISVFSRTYSEVGRCTARNGYPQPRIVWYKDSTPLPDVRNPTSGMYMIPSVVKESSGLYTVNSVLYMMPKKEDKDSKFHCIVVYSMPKEQGKQKSSGSFTLNLNYPMEHMTFSLVNTAPLKEGDEVKLKCETDGNPQPDFEFYKPGTPDRQSGPDGIFTLANVTRNDSGTYKCQFLDIDTIEDHSRSLTLSVNYLDPVVITPSKNITVKQGEGVNLQCKTSASAEYTLQWKTGSSELSNNGNLALSSVKYSNAGLYSCIAKVPSVPGLQKKADITLIVSGKPEIEEPVFGHVGKVGEEVTIMCSAHGYPAPQFTWTPSGRESVSVQDNKVISSVTLETTAAILKDGVTCEASNQHGSDTKVFLVNVKATEESANRESQTQTGSSGVVIAVVVCVLILLIVVGMLYCLQKKGKLPCGEKKKKEVVSGEVNNDKVVVEMRPGEKASEDSELLNKPHAGQ
ncbi:basal cell adhesion molecule isoform X2 [Denticeps clupeoides]|uniref:Ig-like domain-containing protein n=1 Tax=Denticeps clupeoides TaxID=299321 RepID=A0AAY4AGC7_9TELE|nr:basal cell adhesion molecule-like isoform X2 [Denticeps clupeoides]